MGSTEAEIIKQCNQLGRELPQKIQNAPELLPGLELYLWAFNELDTERQMGSSMSGPIPWSKIREFAISYEIDDIDYFHTIIRKLDDWKIQQDVNRIKADHEKTKGLGGSAKLKSRRG